MSADLPRISFPISAEEGETCDYCIRPATMRVCVRRENGTLLTIRLACDACWVWGGGEEKKRSQISTV